MTFRSALSTSVGTATPAGTAAAAVPAGGADVAKGGAAAAAAAGGAKKEGDDDGEWGWKWKLFGVVAGTGAVASVPVFVARSMNQDDVFELELQQRVPQLAAALEPIRPFVGGSLSHDEYDPRYVGHGWQREERYGWGAVTGSEHAVVVRTLNGEAVVPQVSSEDRMPAVLELAGMPADQIVVDVRVS